MIPPSDAVRLHPSTLLARTGHDTATDRIIMDNPLRGPVKNLQHILQTRLKKLKLPFQYLNLSNLKSLININNPQNSPRNAPVTSRALIKNAPSETRCLHPSAFAARWPWDSTHGILLVMAPMI